MKRPDIGSILKGSCRRGKIEGDSDDVIKGASITE